jgi:hypothetical protein
MGTRDQLADRAAHSISGGLHGGRAAGEGPAEEDGDPILGDDPAALRTCQAERDKVDRRRRLGQSFASDLRRGQEPGPEDR